MKIASTLFLFVVVGCTWRETIGTCVFESDFGFMLNCAFKKSGLFRVRNLGGIKGYVGLGLSIGDELGFRDSLSNLEASRRRSVQTRGNVVNVIGNRNDLRKVVPPFKPLPPGASRPLAQQPERQRLIVQPNASSNAIRTIPAPSLAMMQDDILRQQQQYRMQQEAKLRQQQRIQQELLAMQVLKQQRIQQHEAMRVQQKMAQQQMAAQQQMLASQIKRIQSLPPGATAIIVPTKVTNVMPNVLPSVMPSGPMMAALNQASKPLSNNVPNTMTSTGGLPPFIAMPQSSAQLSDRISHSSTILEDSVNEVNRDDYKQLPLPIDDALSSGNDMALLSLHPIHSEPMHNMKQQTSGKRQSVGSPLQSMSPIQGDMQTSLKALVEASNITLEALETAILMRQQELSRQRTSTTTTTTTTTTVLPPIKKLPHSTHNYAAPTKVMNAPREYYPQGYDKNFDDNFETKADLPDTSFYCGDQKHFPGLYADEDLGCMVFHICALTDEGLIMKSFLCPESTLFDQTILKCNWWFYVECKISKSLYDSNLPISKSYQLMKALAFFSAYKNHDNGTQTTEIESKESNDEESKQDES